MKFTAKNYKSKKTKNYVKTNKLFFFVNGINKKSDDWIDTEQNLKNINFKYYKIFNNNSVKILQKSIFTKKITLINGTTFFIKPRLDSKTLSRKILINKFEPLIFTMLAIKLNNKFYSITQLKNNNSLIYCDNKLLLYQFVVTNLKIFNSK